ncbi:putative acyl-CoA oxidase [Lupinus albus]|uniref:Putative acyl-CoA oxidase n=1 Tax=Lupinus albus TaxID=3870 RepID=A0A6A4QHI9_LUPAL|nr:putative acyl-CoA oxidase [Lupinus albus]
MEGVDHLADERNKAQFDVDVMKIVWAGSPHAYEVSHRMSRLVASDPVIILSFFNLLQNFQCYYLSISHLCNAITT